MSMVIEAVAILGIVFGVIVGGVSVTYFGLHLLLKLSNKILKKAK